MHRKSSRLRTLLVVFVSTLIFAEITVRYLGLISFPLYDKDKEIGYLAKANQQGVFMGRNDWFFNDKSMPIRAKFDVSKHPNALLIGNSIIMGGNVYRQSDKVTDLIQIIVGSKLTLWPIANGGWTQSNEIVYLNRHPDVVNNTDLIAWEYMDGGLSGLNTWKGEYTFPTSNPVYATWYLFSKYIWLPYFASSNQSEIPRSGIAQEDVTNEFEDELKRITQSMHKQKPGFIWLYPTASQLTMASSHKEWLNERLLIETIAKKYHLDVLDIAKCPEWNTSYYRDGVHPTPGGNIVLAHIIAKELLSYTH